MATEADQENSAADADAGRERRETRVLGIETEYGISAMQPGFSASQGGFHPIRVEDDLHPMQLSNHVVKAYGASAAGQPATWDYETETPLRDIRGYEISRAAAHPDQLTDSDLGMANVILTNGARLYVDHAHPEYSGPEVTSALDAVRYDKAGDAVMAIAAQRASQALGRSVRLYKNNTDGKGASYGTHENYLMLRSTPFDRIVTQFTAFLVSRQVITGAGRVGIGQSSQTTGFQLSQRADFFEAEVGLETTLNRPIINTRDEPHADASRYRRLHVITGDANLSEISTYLKVGTAAWVLRVIEAGELGQICGSIHRSRRCERSATTSAARSRWRSTSGDRHSRRGAGDLSPGVPAALRADRRRAHRVRPDRGQGSVHPVAGLPGRAAHRRLQPGRPARLGGQAQADGVLPGARRSRLGCTEVGHDRSAVRRRRPAAQPLPALVEGQDAAAGTDEEVERARTTPPEDTRAYFRGRVMEKFGRSVVAASWDSVIFDVPGRPALQRVPLLDPLRGTREQVGQMIDSCNTVADLFAILGR